MPSATSQQARYWLGTINTAHGEWSPPAALPDSIQWLRGQKETGESGNVHWQLFVAFKKKVRLSSVKQQVGNGHWEPSRSEAAESYVWKEDTAIAGTRFELGSKAFNRNSKTDWAKQLQLARSGRIEDCDPDIQIRFYGTLKRIAFDSAPPPQNLTSPCGTWIFGPPGVGKSHSARQWYPNLFVKNLNKWWDGYKGEKQVLLDDVGHEHAKWIGWFLKIWADQYVFDGEIKGGTIKCRPEMLIVTSNYTIEELFFFDVALCDAIKRRFYLINIPNKRF